MKLNKKALSIALGAVVCSFVGVASAHDYVGSINASASANRHDLIQTTCFSWGNGVHPAAPAGEVAGAANRLVAYFSAGGTGLTVQALPNSSGAVSGINTPSYATQYAAGTYTTPNNGVYFVKVNRAASSGSATSFTASFHCTTAAGIASPHTGTGETFSGDMGADSPTVDYRVLVNQ